MPRLFIILVKFALGFVDACYHSVEEFILFHGAVRGGFPYEGGPIQIMVREHGVGRFHARRMEELPGGPATRRRSPSF
jgi:hemerythrin-like domain-containing protein